MRTRIVAAAIVGATLGVSRPAPASVYLTDIWNNGTVSAGFLFPNWTRVPVASYDVLLCAGCVAPSEILTGLTIANFGSATDADIAGVYWQVRCSSVNSGLFTMTYAGTYNLDYGALPAWTWAGVSPDLDGCADYCGGTCGGWFTITVYADIAPCPTEFRTLRMGLPINSAFPWWGSLSDNNGFVLPWEDLVAETRTILYSLKEGPANAAPGDTVAYTITYGKPGTAAISNFIVMDTLPPYAHYVAGSAVPAPDVGWDPDPGPPLRLRWTRPGAAPAGGATTEIRFSVTVDWGNGEAFEPGSGDQGAPEGVRMGNRAQVFPEGSDCTAAFVTGQVNTVARRFLFWKEADNDVLFSASYGQSPDEITYTLVIRNMSTLKTWWNTDVWDTVPAELDVWCAGCGFDDPCVGWTMTPGGCAAATPGRMIAGGATILTWRLDLPPAMTLALRWRAHVRGSTTAGATSLNRASIMARGLTGIVTGTGHSGPPRVFTHEAPILLPTTYTSYLGFGTAEDFAWACPKACPDGDMPLIETTYWIAFYPLNKKADFSMYQQLHFADAFADFGGVSPPISAFAGGCLVATPDWVNGCKAERAPAIFRPAAYASCPGFTRTRNLYKLVANSPLIWELLTAVLDDPNDQGTYTGTTSLTYAGYTAYSFARICEISIDARDGFYLVNTSAANETSVHAFWWDAVTLAWRYLSSGDVGRESLWFYPAGAMGHYKFISSQGPLVVYKGYPGLLDTNGNNNHGTQVPTTQNGYLVPSAAPADFYLFAGGPTSGDMPSLVVGNWGGVVASYQVWQYQPDNPALSTAGNADHLTARLVDTSGTWRLLATDAVPAGIANPGNPKAYGFGYDQLFAEQYGLYKVRLLSGGPVQVYGGRDIYSGFASGHVLHATDAQPSGAVYWFHQASTSAKNGASFCAAPYSNIMGLDFYCPRQGTKVELVSGSGYKAAYTTTGPDECVFFQRLTNPVAPDRENWVATGTGGIIVSAFNITCQMKQKLYTAPFLGQGVHYQVIAPAVAFIGQPFWITIVVVDVGNTTKTDYCGTSTFTATDPGAKIEGAGMDAYNFTWESASAPCGLSPFDDGVRVFVNVILTRLGLQTVVAVDTIDGSINGLATVMVVGVDVKLEKRAPLTVAASADTVQFRICWSNYSSGSAFTFVVNDAVPRGTTYLPEAGTWALSCGSTDGVAPAVAYSVSTGVTIPPAGSFVTANPVAATRWLRWTVPVVGVETTGCLCFRVTVN